MRVTADTNLIVSAALWGGNPRRVIDSARDDFFELYTSPVLINELKEILGRGKFEKQFLQVGFTPEDLVEELLGFAIVIEGDQLPFSIARDPDDDAVVACAVSAECEFIVTGDQDLLVLTEYRGIRIVTATEFLSELEL
ncbi:MAG: putative toxin-antitoxin system toxin component, PIN family [Pyrinomonadaceae bacterium]